jgi:hypothetical protein
MNLKLNDLTRQATRTISKKPNQLQLTIDAKRNSKNSWPRKLIRAENHLNVIGICRLNIFAICFETFFMISLAYIL